MFPRSSKCHFSFSVGHLAWSNETTVPRFESIMNQVSSLLFFTIMELSSFRKLEVSNFHQSSFSKTGKPIIWIHSWQLVVSLLLILLLSVATAAQVAVITRVLIMYFIILCTFSTLEFLKFVNLFVEIKIMRKRLQQSYVIWCYFIVIYLIEKKPLKWTLMTRNYIRKLQWHNQQFHGQRFYFIWVLWFVSIIQYY